MWIRLAAQVAFPQQNLLELEFPRDNRENAFWPVSSQKQHIPKQRWVLVSTAVAVNYPDESPNCYVKSRSDVSFQAGFENLAKNAIVG